MLRRRIKQYREEAQGGLPPFPSHGRPKDGELARLRKENKVLREASEILIACLVFLQNYKRTHNRENDREGEQDKSNISQRHYPGAVFADRTSVKVGTKGDTPANLRFIRHFLRNTVCSQRRMHMARFAARFSQMEYRLLLLPDMERDQARREGIGV
jgi:hypothetical protein